MGAICMRKINMTDLEIQTLCLNIIKSLELAAKAHEHTANLVFKLQKELNKPKMEIVKDERENSQDTQEPS